MTHTKTCPLYRFAYELGSGQDIPECDCMTDRFKKALSALLRIKKYSGHSHENTFKEMFLGHIDVIESALTIATEAEQLRKERDNYKDGLIKIASYKEGKEVTSSFDEPHSAKIARKCLGENNGSFI